MINKYDRILKKVKINNEELLEIKDSAIYGLNCKECYFFDKNCVFIDCLTNQVHYKKDDQ